MKPLTYGFGVNPEQAQNHFYVWIPSTDNISPPSTDITLLEARKNESRLPVQVYERFTWTAHGEQLIGGADRLRIELSKHKWGEVRESLAAEFNARLKKDGAKTGKFPVKGGVAVERLLGKEMMVLLWAVEDCDPSVITTAVRNWKGLLPEERWWLYTMTNAATGELSDRKGWRKALRFALCENPVIERKQISFFDTLVE